MAEVMEFEQEVGELETVTAEIQEQEQQQAAPEPEVDPDIPEKYRGKTVKDIVKMHQDTERSLSRQGQELGEIRRLADELIKSQLQPKKEPEQPKEVDYFENPDEAVSRRISNHPDVRAAKEYAEAAQRELAKQKIPCHMSGSDPLEGMKWSSRFLYLFGQACLGIFHLVCIPSRGCSLVENPMHLIFPDIQARGR